MLGALIKGLINGVRYGATRGVVSGVDDAAAIAANRADDVLSIGPIQGNAFDAAVRARAGAATAARRGPEFPGRENLPDNPMGPAIGGRQTAYDAEVLQRAGLRNPQVAASAERVAAPAERSIDLTPDTPDIPKNQVAAVKAPGRWGNTMKILGAAGAGLGLDAIYDKVTTPAAQELPKFNPAPVEAPKAATPAQAHQNKMIEAVQAVAGMIGHAPRNSVESKQFREYVNLYMQADQTDRKLDIAGRYPAKELNMLDQREMYLHNLDVAKQSGDPAEIAKAATQYANYLNGANTTAANNQWAMLGLGAQAPAYEPDIN